MLAINANMLPNIKVAEMLIYCHISPAKKLAGKAIIPMAPLYKP